MKYTFIGDRSPDEIPMLPKVLRGVDWHYCDLCRVPYVCCDACGNTSCNAGGCDECTELFKAASKYHKYITREEAEEPMQFPNVQRNGNHRWRGRTDGPCYIDTVGDERYCFIETKCVDITPGGKVLVMTPPPNPRNLQWKSREL